MYSTEYSVERTLCYVVICMYQQATWNLKPLGYNWRQIITLPTEYCSTYILLADDEYLVLILAHGSEVEGREGIAAGRSRNIKPSLFQRISRLSWPTPLLSLPLPIYSVQRTEYMLLYSMY